MSTNRPFAGSLCFLLTLLVNPCQRTNSAEPPQPAKLDVLIVAPHSDDEAIGCYAVMRRALARQQRVGVVIVTASDGFPKAAAAAAKKDPEQLTASDFINLAALRERHSRQAMAQIGVPANDLIFLGYPDGGLDKMYKTDGEIAYRQPFTGKTETYGLAVADYHRVMHGRPAPYVRASLVNDLVEIIRARQPREIYVTNEADRHPDHRATFRYVRDAVRAAQYEGTLWTFVVHGDPLNNPAQQRLTLSKSELDAKRALLESYQVGVSPVHDRLAETYAKPEELFWKSE